jgi:hypothetical protein
MDGLKAVPFKEVEFFPPHVQPLPGHILHEMHSAGKEEAQGLT